MSLADYIKTKEYIVTVKDFSDLETIYSELETEGESPPNIDLKRSVQCILRRDTSRNTHYLLTDWEAELLKNDPRILSVTPTPSRLGIQAGLHVQEQEIIESTEEYTNSIDVTSSVQQTSSGWDKSSSTSSSMKNWALLRCTEGLQRIGWGGTGYQGNGSGTASQTGTIELTQTGKNVDVVICDQDGLVWNHPEFAKYSTGTGGTRTIQYNWFQHNVEIGAGPNSFYTYGEGDHSTHVAGTVAGNTQGWARDANIYNIYYDAGDTGNFSLVFDYVRAFHRNKSINPATGRKNPTIVNNSWGMSIFPNQWSFNDITAVTYRGIRYTPVQQPVTYTGYSGVCTSNTRLATLVGEENVGNRITTTGSYIPPAGYILTKPVAWSQTGQQATLTALTQPNSMYELTIQGPADIDLVHNVAIDSVSGYMSIEGEIIILNNLDVEVARYSEGPHVSLDGGSLEINIRPSTLNLPSGIVYKVQFTTTITTPQESLFATAMSLTVVTESTPASANVVSITNSLLGPAALASSTIPTYGDNDDGYWTLTLPFNIAFLGTSYSTIYVGTNHYVTFGAGSTAYYNLGQSNPNLPKIMWSSFDNSVQRIYYGTEGSAPNRTYRVRIEGNANISGTLGNPGMVCEYTFYESNPNRIDLQLGINNRKTASSGFTTEQLNNWGFIAGQRIPARVPALDADLETAYTEGIIMVGAAGNGRWKHVLPEDADWNNSFEMAIRYPDSVSNPYYYMQGTSPTANDNLEFGTYELPAICVGAVDSIQFDQKVLFSDCGTGVDLWAPGTGIISSLPSFGGVVADPRNSNYFLGKYNGTSMASPQVCGVLACALEIYPHMNQYAAKQYILGYAKLGQLTVTSGGPADGQDLQGAPNLFLYYAKERVTAGNNFPKLNYQPRPTSGAVYPRTRIRRTLQ